MYHATQAFEINGHGASVCCQFNFMHITVKDQYNLPNRQRIWIHWIKNNSTFGDFYAILFCEIGCARLPRHLK